MALPTYYHDLHRRNIDDFDYHIAIGNTATVQAGAVVNLDEQFTAVAGTYTGLLNDIEFAPTANFATSVYGLNFTLRLTTAWARTAGGLFGIYGRTRVDNAVGATNLNLVGIQCAADVNDASATVAEGLISYTPFVDTGACSTGRGIRIAAGTLGAGSITTLYGLYIENVTNGGTNWAIYTNTGDIRFGDDVLVGTTSPPAAGSGRVLVFGDNGGDPTPAANTCGFYGKDVAGTVEAFCVDEGGVATQLSPHDPETGEWIFYSQNTRTGRVMRVDMEQLVKFLDDYFGTSFVQEWIE